jgi:hypothetical protein
MVSCEVMMAQAVHCLVGATLLWMTACSDSNSHPPFCNDKKCIPSGETTINASSSGGADGAGGATTSQAGSGTIVSITGQVVEVQDPDFGVSTANASSGTYTVTAPTAGGTLFDTVVASTFTLDGVAWSKSAWLAARPATAGQFWPGLVAFDSTTKTSVVVPVVRKDSLDLVSNVLTTLTTLDTSKAQVVLRFIDPNGQLVSGVTVAMIGAERIAYDAGNSYTDDAKSTGSKGLAFLFNVGAAATPMPSTVNLSGVVAGQINVWIQNGTATAADILVSKQ